MVEDYGLEPPPEYRETTTIDLLRRQLKMETDRSAALQTQVVELLAAHQNALNQYSRALDALRKTEMERDNPVRLTAEQLHVLLHALGLRFIQPPFRNHFVTGPGSTDWPTCHALVLLGLLQAHTRLGGNDPWFSVTPEGYKFLQLSEGELPL